MDLDTARAIAFKYLTNPIDWYVPPGWQEWKEKYQAAEARRELGLSDWWERI